MSRVIEHGNAILDSLCEATGALGALVRDASSPAQWWQSRHVHRPVTRASLDNLYDLALAEAAAHPLREGGLLRLIRQDEAPCGLGFSFAGIYLLLVVFEEPFNRFAIEPQARRALPLLERLVPRLPPIDDGGTVVGMGSARGQQLPVPPKK